MSSTQPTIDRVKLTMKPSAFTELLRTHHSVFVHLDSRQQDVIVPKQLRQPQLRLQLGLNMECPMPDLKSDENGFSATLRFGGTFFHVVVPWSAVYVIVGDSGIGNVWEKDAPPEADIPRRNATFDENMKTLQTGRDPEKHKNLPPGFRVIEGGKK